MKLGYVSSGHFIVMKEAMLVEGVDPTLLLEQFGITDTLMESTHAHVSLSRYMRICREAIKLTSKPWLGLLTSKQLHIGNMGLPGFAAITAATLSDALSTYIEFEHINGYCIWSKSHYYRDPQNSSPVCQFDSFRPYNHYNYYSVDSALSQWHQLVSIITGRSDLLEYVDIEYADLGCGSVFEEYFQCPVHFGAERNALVFTPDSTELPSTYSNQRSHNMLREVIAKEQIILSDSNLFSKRVSTAIIPMLSVRAPDIDEVAEKLSIATWTLQRRLKKENTSYQELLDYYPQRDGIELCWRQHLQFF